MDVAESMKAGGTHPALKHVYEIKALVQERDHQTKRMACAVKVFDSRCLVTSSDVDCKKPFIMDRYSRRHSYRLDSSVIECQTFERFSFLLLNEDITHRKQYIFDLPLKVRSPGGTVYVYGFGQSFTLDPEKRELDNNDLLGSPIVQEIVNVTGNEPNQAVVGVVGLSDKGKLCPCFITKKILDQLKESLEEDVKAKGQLEESLEDVNNGCNPKESEEKAAIKHSGENPGETSDVEDQQGGESSGQPGEATDGRTQPSGNTGPARLGIKFDCEVINGRGAPATTMGMGMKPHEPHSSVQDDAALLSIASNQPEEVRSSSKVGNGSTPSGDELLRMAAHMYLRNNNLSKPEEFNNFLQYLKELKLVLVGTGFGSLIITVEIRSLQILEDLWKDYRTGHLNKMAQKFLLTEDVLKEFGVSEVRLTTTIAEEEYRACRDFFERSDQRPATEEKKEYKGDGESKAASDETQSKRQAGGESNMQGDRDTTDAGKTEKEPVEDERRLKITLATNDEDCRITITNQLLGELVRNPLLKVSAFVPSRTQELIDWAKKFGPKFQLMAAEEKGNIGYFDEQLLDCPPDSLDIDILIIHSYENEQEARPQSKQKASEHDVQLALCKQADIVIAIGPRLADFYRSALCSSAKVFDLTPEIIPDLIGVRPVREDGAVFRVFISATYHDKYFRVKGCDIAAKAISLLKDTSYHIIFVVLDTDNAKELQTQVEKEIQLSQFTVKKFSRDPVQWSDLLRAVNLAILPSRAEGFGTSCLRAMSADLPVLVSGNTGLGMALKKLPSEGKRQVVYSEDPQHWADRIREVKEMGAESRAAEAKKLRTEYMEEFNWKKQCGDLIEKMFGMFPNKKDGSEGSASGTRYQETEL